MGCVQNQKWSVSMNRHTQHYLGLNPQPTAKRLILECAYWLGYVVYGAGMVYLLTVLLFSF
jgi:hypothetical protein